MQLAKRPVRSSNASKCVPNSAAAVARAAGRHAWRQHGAARQQGDARRGVAVAAQPEGNSDPRYAYSDPVNQFLGGCACDCFWPGRAAPISGGLAPGRDSEWARGLGGRGGPFDAPPRAWRQSSRAYLETTRSTPAPSPAPTPGAPAGNFLPPARDAAAELAHINWDTPKAQGLSLQELAARFTQEFLRREWFVTGDVSARARPERRFAAPPLGEPAEASLARTQLSRSRACTPACTSHTHSRPAPRRLGPPGPPRAVQRRLCVQGRVGGHHRHPLLCARRAQAV